MMERESKHYSYGRRFSFISNAWILNDSWNDKEEIAALRVDLSLRKEELRQAQAALAAKDQQVQAWQMAYEGVQQQLAAKDARVKELEDWKRIVEGTGTDQEAVVRMAATEYTKTAVQTWKDHTAKLEQQLAAKDQELKRLKDRHHPSCNVLLDDEGDEVLTDYQECTCAIHAQEDLAYIRKLKQQLDTLMGEAVQLANDVIHCSFDPNRTNNAQAFLARPDVQALEKGTPPCE